MKTILIWADRFKQTGGALACEWTKDGFVSAPFAEACTIGPAVICDRAGRDLFILGYLAPETSIKATE